MRTGSMNVPVHRWPLAAALAVSIHLLGVGVGVAEEDHLKGYKIKDLNQVPATNPVTLTNQFGSETCDLKKPQFLLMQSEKNGGDDPRGGPAGNFVCYKAKCTGPLPPVIEGSTQFGIHSLEAKKAKLVCLPVDKYVCGDGNVDPGEACDGTDDSACPNDCLPDCTCAPVCPQAGGDPTACTAFSTLATCTACCTADTLCNFWCTDAVTNACGNSFSNQYCTVYANAAGCAAECCP